MKTKKWKVGDRVFVYGFGASEVVEIEANGSVTVRSLVSGQLYGTPCLEEFRDGSKPLSNREALACIGARFWDAIYEGGDYICN